jgi:hypothetical protein
MVDFGIEVSASPWHNVSRPNDVNNDQVVTPLDALLIINDINTYSPRVLATSGSGGFVPPPFIDVNNDGLVSPIDALLVINHLNSSAANGEAPPLIGPALPSGAFDGSGGAGSLGGASGPGGASSPGGSGALNAVGGEGDWAAWFATTMEAARNAPSAASVTDVASLVRDHCRVTAKRPTSLGVRWSNDAEADEHSHEHDHDHADHDHADHDHADHDHAIDSPVDDERGEFAFGDVNIVDQIFAADWLS